MSDDVVGRQRVELSICRTARRRRTARHLSICRTIWRFVGRLGGSPRVDLSDYFGHHSKDGKSTLIRTSLPQSYHMTYTHIFECVVRRACYQLMSKVENVSCDMATTNSVMARVLLLTQQRRRLFIEDRHKITVLQYGAQQVLSQFTFTLDLR